MQAGNGIRNAWDCSRVTTENVLSRNGRARLIEHESSGAQGGVERLGGGRTAAKPLPSNRRRMDEELTDSGRQRGMETSRSTLGKTVSKFIEGIAVVRGDMLEAHGSRHASNEQEGGSKTRKIMMPPITPHRFSGPHGKERVRADADIARWAVDNHPNQGPENGSQLHTIAITSRIPLDHRPGAGRTVEQGPEEVEARGATTDDNDRPAEPSRERGGGRRGRAVSINKNF